MKFRPEEVLFSPTTRCNLACPHCDIIRAKKKLPAPIAIGFLTDCKRRGIDRVGFTGGEPFLALDFLCAVTKRAVALGMYFNRMMTNGVWFRNTKDLEHSLNKLKNAGYDGSICVSVDAFHRQSIKKLIQFIRKVSGLWNRRNMVTIAYVAGARACETQKKVRRILSVFPGLRTYKIGLSPVGKAAHLLDPWNGKWFKEDYCRGPGNTFFVMPDGSVKPCCGYANENEELTIGNIRRDSVKKLLLNLKKNRLAFTIFNSGLSAIRKRLEKHGFRFPGKTSNHCFFCNYIIESVPKTLLKTCLD